MTGVIKNLEIIRPIKQKVWGWPAVVNFALGGMATGFYLLNVLIETFYGNGLVIFSSAAFKLLAPLLVCIGLLALTVEAGRPLRIQYLLNNLRGSWMSRETLLGALFILFAVADTFFTETVFRVMATLAATGFLISQGFILYNARAVTSWNLRLIPVIFLTSGLAMGVGLMLLLSGFYQLFFSRSLLMIGLILLMTDLVMWLIYVRWSLRSVFHIAIRILRPIVLISTVAIGHLIPAVFILMIWLLKEADAGFKAEHFILLLSGTFILIGGLSQKFSIVLWTGYLRGITITHVR